MENKSASIEAIRLTRAVFESVHGNLGLLRFNIEELTPVNGQSTDESRRWDIVCSFFETLGSTMPSRYRVLVNLNDNTVTIKKIGGEENEPEKKFTVEPEE